MPVWPADGRHVLFASTRDGSYGAWLVDPTDAPPSRSTGTVYSPGRVGRRPRAPSLCGVHPLAYESGPPAQTAWVLGSDRFRKLH